MFFVLFLILGLGHQTVAQNETVTSASGKGTFSDVI